MLDRLLEAASCAVDHVLVEPSRVALWRGDDQDLVGWKVVERVGDCLHRVGVGELAVCTDVAACEAGDGCPQAPRRISARGVFVDIPLGCGRAVRGRDDESLDRPVADVVTDASAETGRVQASSTTTSTR